MIYNKGKNNKIRSGPLSLDMQILISNKSVKNIPKTNVSFFKTIINHHNSIVAII